MTPAQRDEFIARIDERTMQMADAIKKMHLSQKSFDDRLTDLAKEIGKLNAEFEGRICTLEADNSSHKSQHRWGNVTHIAFGVATTLAGALGIKTLEGIRWP